MIGLLGGYGETAVMAGLFALAMFTVMFIANTVTAILYAPVAIAAAQIMGIDPHGFEMAVAVASSTAFISPLSSPVNMLVMNPGAVFHNSNGYIHCGNKTLAILTECHPFARCKNFKLEAIGRKSTFSPIAN